MTEFLLVQHAGDFQEAKYNSDGQFDPSIGPKGIERAKALRKRLENKQIDAFYMSNLRRSIETIEIISEGRDVPLLTHPGLREISLGEFEPRHIQFNSLVEQATEPAIVEFLDTRSWDAIPGGESDASFRARCRATIEDIGKSWPKATVVVGAHGASIGAIVAEMTGAKSTILFYPEPCSVTSFVLDGENATFLLVNSCTDRDVMYDFGSPIYKLHLKKELGR